MKYFISILIPLLFCISGHANWDFRGHYRGLGSSFYSNHGNLGESPLLSQSILNARLITLKNSDKWSFEAAYEFFFTYNYNPIRNNELADFKYRFSDIEKYLFHYNENKITSYYGLQNLDRLYLSYQKPNFKLTIGRQVISFGPARTVNPLDVLVPFDFLMINLEQKTGVDAIRLTVPTAEMSEFEVGMVFDKDLHSQQQFKFITFANSFNNLDFRLYLMSLYQHLIQGLDFQGSIFNWGIWLEYGHFNLWEGKQFERYSFGAQYFFKNDINFFWEYHFNGAGHALSENYQSNFSQSFQRELAIFLTSKNYLNTGISYPITPIKILNLTIFNNLNDGSQLISPSLEHNMALDWYFSLGAFIGTNGSSKKNSEFGQYPRAIFASIKNFF